MPDEAAVVRQVFDLCISGICVYEIALRLNQLGAGWQDGTGLFQWLLRVQDPDDSLTTIESMSEPIPLDPLIVARLQHWQREVEVFYFYYVTPTRSNYVYLQIPPAVKQAIHQLHPELMVQEVGYHAVTQEFTQRGQDHGNISDECFEPTAANSGAASSGSIQDKRESELDPRVPHGRWDNSRKLFKHIPGSHSGWG